MSPAAKTLPVSRAATAQLVLGCTACPHLWLVTESNWTGLESTGCPRCGGWSWLAQLDHGVVPAPRMGEQA